MAVNRKDIEPVFAEMRRIWAANGKTVLGASKATGIHRDTVKQLLERRVIWYSAQTLDRLGYEYVRSGK